jgi:tryptophan-rich sensory protein
MTLTTRAQVLGLIGWLVLCLAAGALGAVASMDAANFYGQLSQPDWAPPASVFGPVWTVLYVLMAVAAWLAWRIGGFAHARLALTLSHVQLALNALWSWLFFAWHRGALAFVDIVVLAGLVVATCVAFWRHRPLAGALLLPYLGWVLFATALNFAVWRAIPTLLG